MAQGLGHRAQGLAHRASATVVSSNFFALAFRWKLSIVVAVKSNGHSDDDKRAKKMPCLPKMVGCQTPPTDPV